LRGLPSTAGSINITLHSANKIIVEQKDGDVGIYIYNKKVDAFCMLTVPGLDRADCTRMFQVTPNNPGQILLYEEGHDEPIVRIGNRFKKR
jgi:hypothetical protein